MTKLHSPLLDGPASRYGEYCIPNASASGLLSLFEIQHLLKPKSLVDQRSRFRNTRSSCPYSSENMKFVKY